MSFVKKIVFFSIAVMLISSFFVSVVKAEVGGGGYGLLETGKKANYVEITEQAVKNDTFYAFINRVVTIGLSILVFVFFGMLSYAGIRWMTASGNDEKAAKAKGILEGSVIGLAIVVSAYALTAFIFSRIDSNLPAEVPKVESPAPELPVVGDISEPNLAEIQEPVIVCMQTPLSGLKRTIPNDSGCLGAGGTCMSVASCGNGTKLYGCCSGGNDNICCKKPQQNEDNECRRLFGGCSGECEFRSPEALEDCKAFCQAALETCLN